MRHGKHCESTSRLGRRRVAPTAPSGLGRKRAVLTVSLLMALALVCGGTIAWLTDKDQVINTFSPGEVTTTVVEHLDGETKRDVKIQNTGTVDAWIRATVVVSWQDAEGNVYGELPVEQTVAGGTGDYSITFNVDKQSEFDNDKWTRGADGFWYWSGRVEPNGTTGVLIAECKLAGSGKGPAGGYSLCVEVVGSGIQAGGADESGTPAVETAWSNDKTAVTVSCEKLCVTDKARATDETARGAEDPEGATDSNGSRS